MRTSTPPNIGTTGPRNPIRVWRLDHNAPVPQGDYLTLFEDVMTRVFVAAFRQAEKRGRL